MKVSGKVGALVFSGLLLVVSMASASVLDSFGVISGEVDVEGPTFYADAGNDLIVNDGESAVSATYSVAGQETIFEDTQFGDSLDASKWYPMELDLSVRASINNESQNSEGQLDLNFRYIENGNTREICSTKVNVTGFETENYVSTCTPSQEVPSFNTEIGGFNYKIEAGSSNTEFNVVSGSETNVTVSAQ